MFTVIFNILFQCTIQNIMEYRELSSCVQAGELTGKTNDIHFAGGSSDRNFGWRGVPSNSNFLLV